MLLYYPQMSLSHVSTFYYKSQVVSGNISDSIGERVRVRKLNTLTAEQLIWTPTLFSYFD